MMKYKNFDDIKNKLWDQYIANLQIENCSQIIVFGCGDLGTQLMDHFDAAYRSHVLCLCDNNQKLWGQERNGKRIYSPFNAVEKYPEAVFVIAVARETDKIKKQLTELGISQKMIVNLVVNDSGECAREYLAERLNSDYLLDNSIPSEAAIPVIRSKNVNDKRDFRIYIEKGLTRNLDVSRKILDRNFMDEYEQHYGKYIRVDDIPTNGTNKNSLKVMITCSHKDYASMEQDNADIYIPIQVGKALTDISLYDLKDDYGDNISDRNYNYCECTALYWAWKNGFAKDDDYLGLRHYRRRFDASDDILYHLKENNIDIVHLDPIYHDNIRYSFVNHTKNENDWDVMKIAIKERFPEYYPAMLEYEDQHYVCGYNMNILRRDIFDEYCSFLFGVLLYIEDYYLKICDRRDRYLGFLAENLFGVFLIKNKEKYTQAITKLIPYIKYC